VDQSHTFQVNMASEPTFRNFAAGIPPTGFLFTPTFSSLNFVESFLSDPQSSEPYDGMGTSFTVSVFDKTLNTKLGTSALVSLPDFFDSVVRFRFEPTLRLAPGDQLLAEFNFVSGDDTWAINIDWVEPPGGNLIEAGGLIPAYAWFREGLIVPEPSSTELLVMGAIGIVVYASRYSAKARFVKTI